MKPARQPLCAMKQQRRERTRRYGKATRAQTAARARLLKKLEAPELTSKELAELRAKHNAT